MALLVYLGVTSVEVMVLASIVLLLAVHQAQDFVRLLDREPEWFGVFVSAVGILLGVGMLGAL